MFSCTCGDEQIVTDNGPQVETVSEAGCGQEQTVAYTATVSINGKDYSDSTDPITVPGTATGHIYGEPVWSWASDYSSATAVFSCTCGDKQIVTDNDPQVITVSEADDENDKVVRYTATVSFGGADYSTETDDITVPGETPSEPDENEDDGLCKWCGKDHSGSFWQGIVGFFHRILYFFAHLFGLR